MSNINKFPPQQLPFNRKNKKWRKECVSWGADRTFFNYEPVRNSVSAKKINYDLVRGKLHMEDLALIINPDKIKASYIPDTIQHYPIINSKLQVLIGEESNRVFDYKVIVTNPNAVSEIENNKKKALLQQLQDWVSNTTQSDEEAQAELEKISDYFTYEWQDIREVRANALLHHYIKELNIPLIFNDGFQDALIAGEEIYQCDIRGGEPVIERVDPLKIRVFRSGTDNKIENADMIVMEDYWSPGKIIDTYYESLTAKDRKYIEELPDATAEKTDAMDNIDERAGFIHKNMAFGDEETDTFFWDPIGGSDNIASSLSPYDIAGNIRVVRVYWKSRRKIKKVKAYDPETGEETFKFYPETYIIDEDRGEEEQIFYINEAWEGTKIGENIYVNMRPKVIQYNRLSNPSLCHFGIIGQIYNVNNGRPYSLVSMMKPFNYLYDVIHDRLNKLIARNWGSLVRLDLAKIPKGWEVDKWLYFAKVNGLAVEDSFKEGDYGAATGKLAGGLNNASSGVIPTSDGNQIQQYTNLLEFIKLEMSEVSGITKQREGQIQNRETVGGVERATLQSTHITERLFFTHEDVKRRALECFLETAKIAIKGRSKKFQYILSDTSQRIIDIDGDEYAECDYGLAVDNSTGIQELSQKLDMLAQAALQNQALDFSTIMKLYTSCSLAEKQRMVENNERKLKEMQQQQQQQEMQLQQQQMEQQAQMAQAQMEQQYLMNQENNETKIQVAIINGEAEAQRFAMMNDDNDDHYTEKDKADLMEKMRQFDKKLQLDKEKLDFEKKKHAEDNALKDKISQRQAKKNSNNK